MKKTIRLLRGFTRHMTKSNVNAHASCAAYFMFLSLIPIIILLCSLLPYTSLEKSDLLRGVAQVMPCLLYTSHGDFFFLRQIAGFHDNL